MAPSWSTRDAWTWPYPEEENDAWAWPPLGDGKEAWSSSSPGVGLTRGLHPKIEPQLYIYPLFVAKFNSILESQPMEDGTHPSF